MARRGSMCLYYSPSVWSSQRWALEIELPAKDTTFREVLYAALDQLLILEGKCGGEDNVFVHNEDEEEWMILEAWNGLERRVALSECPAHLLGKWGSFVSQVQLILRPKETAREQGGRGKRSGRRHRSKLHSRRSQQDHCVVAIRALSAERKSLQSVDGFLQVLKRLGVVQKELTIVTKHLHSVEKDIRQEEDLEKMRQRAQFLKKETEAKNELNGMQHAKMKEQKAVLEEKKREIDRITAELSELQRRKTRAKGTAPSRPVSTSTTDLGARQICRTKSDNSTSLLRASICDDGRYLAESLEGKHHTGHHTPPSWTRTQSAQSTGFSPRTSPYNSLQRRSFTPQSSKRRSEHQSLTRKNSEEGLVLKFSEEKRKSTDKDLGTIAEDSVSKKLDFSQSGEESPTAPEEAGPEDKKYLKVGKTSIQMTVHQGKMLDPSLLPGQPEEGSPSATPIGETRSKLRGILKGGRDGAGCDEVDLGPSGPGKKVKFDGISILFSAALEGEFEVFVEASRQLRTLDITSYQGVTPLHYAVCSGSMDIVRYAVSHGVDVNQQDQDGWTPLHCCASCSNLEMVQYLIHNGASIFMKTGDGQTPLRVAFEEFEESGDAEGSAASECLDYLLFVQQELGSINNGVVYALFDYLPIDEGYTVDEESGLLYLSLGLNESVRILSKGGDQEREEELWWVAENKQRQKGLVPCTLLGTYPRCIGGKV